MDQQRHGEECSLPLPLDHGPIDVVLGGGLRAARLHEFFTDHVNDAASASGFAAMVACQRAGAVVWIRHERGRGAGFRLHAEGLAETGFDPSRLLLCKAPDSLEALKTANEAARCPQVAVVVLELWRHVPALSLTVSRRLALSAEISGTMVLMLRIGVKPIPSAAATRWLVASAPSSPLPAKAPGHATFDLTLLRQRNRGGEGAWRVTWDRERLRFTHVAPVSGTVRSTPVLRPADVASERSAA